MRTESSGSRRKHEPFRALHGWAPQKLPACPAVESDPRGRVPGAPVERVQPCGRVPTRTGKFLAWMAAVVVVTPPDSSQAGGRVQPSPGVSSSSQPPVVARTVASDSTAGWQREFEGRARTVTLAEIVGRAKEGAPRLGPARALRGQAQAERVAGSVLAPADPYAQANVGARTDGSDVALDWQLSIQQRLEVAGEPGLRRKAARRRVAEVERHVEWAQWEAVQDARAAYLAAVVARERLRLTSILHGFAERLLTLARRREAVGEGSGLELRLAAGEAAMAAQEQIAARTDFRLACHRLALFIGWTDAQIPVPGGPLPSITAVPAKEQIAIWLDDRADVRKVQARVEHAEAAVEAARRDRWPEATFGAQLQQEPRLGTDRRETVAYGTLGLSFPVWGRQRAEVARARADLEAAQAERSRLQLILPVEVTMALEAARGAAQRVDVYQDQILPRFEDNLELVERAFELGELTIMDVVSATRRFTEVQQQAMDAHQAYVEALAALEAAVGRPVYQEPS